MRILGRLILASLVLVLAACSDDSNGKLDGKVPDQKVGDAPPPPTELICGSSDCRDFVFSKLTLPDTNNPIGHDYDNDGSPDNALGSILGGLSTMAGGSLNIQEAVDGGVNSGSTLVLLRMQADDFASDDSSKAQAWVGAKTACCSDPDDKPGCAAEAKTKCFAGGATFFPDKDSPSDALFNGRIANKKMFYGPSKLKFVLPFTGAGDLELNLLAVYLEGEVAADGKSISKGVLAGAISQDDLNNTLIPTIADMLNTTLTDPTTDPQVAGIITTLFDGNTDGTITKEEVKDSSIVKTFLGGDVDVDNDGEKELSLGVAFEAVSAVIDDKGTPPDGGPKPDQAPPDAGPDGPAPDGPAPDGPVPDAPGVD